MIQQSLSGAWEFRQLTGGEWMPAQVPGSVHLDLLSAGRIPDPFFGDNEKAVQWVSETDWEYSRTFTVGLDLLSEQRVILVCDGLDTRAEIYVNGNLVGKANNMYRTFSWDVRSFLNEGENKISISFLSPVKYVTARNEERYLATSLESIEGGTYLRKAPYHFGWDWGPRLPSAGIWRDLRLEGRSHACFSDVRIRQRHENGIVYVSAAISTDRFDDLPLTAQFTIKTPDGDDYRLRAEVGSEPVTVEIPIENPRLWWPNGYGEQPLYDTEITLMAGNEPVDARRYSLGLRKLELRQEPDKWGRSFTFVVNDVPIFVKGANWIPADVFSTRVTDTNLEYLIRSAADVHMNMLRIWGGGLYGDEPFYNLCDRYGILVWQDFMFACGIYPLDDSELAHNIRQEVTEVIRRLRHRACLALWCGNNEMEWGWTEWGWDTSWWEDLKQAYDQFFHITLPGLCAEEDPDRPYWPSSPSSGTSFINPNGDYQGDMHYWEVWHQRKPFSAYKDTYPRFMSEFGFQALPPMETIRSYADPEELNLTSYTMEHHQRSPVGNDLIISQMAAHFRMPKDFPATVYLSMVLQAEGIRFGVEHWRRNKHRVSGTLYWQLNDVWPVASWSSIDYYGRWKALHYAARRFYAPLLVSIDQKQTLLKVWLTSDLSTPWEGMLAWTLETLSGEIIDAGEQPASILPFESRPVLKLDYSDRVNDQNRRNLVCVVRLIAMNQQVGQAAATFVPDKHLRLSNPGLEMDVLELEDKFGIRIEASKLARFIELSIEGIDTVFSDNYFDLRAGEARVITFPKPEDLPLEAIRSRMRAISLFDSYAS